MNYQELATRLRQTRANMLGTDDEQHYWDVHDAADAIDRLSREVNEARHAGKDDLSAYLAKKLDEADQLVEQCKTERDFLIRTLRQMAALERDVRDLQQASKYYEEMAIRARLEQGTTHAV